MDKKLIGLMLLFVLSFTIFISVIVFNKPLSTLTRAKEDAEPSDAKSLMFAWPLSTRADGRSEVTISVFVRTTTDKPLSGKKVSIVTNHGTIREVTSETDKSGKATFMLFSDSPGVADLTALIESSLSLQQKVSVKFE